MGLKFTFIFNDFDDVLPFDNSEILVMSENDDVGRFTFRKNDGSYDKSVLGVLYRFESLHSDNEHLVYNCKVYKNDESINSWCYPYSFEFVDFV